MCDKYSHNLNCDCEVAMVLYRFRQSKILLWWSCPFALFSPPPVSHFLAVIAVFVAHLMLPQESWFPSPRLKINNFLLFINGSKTEDWYPENLVWEKVFYLQIHYYF